MIFHFIRRPMASLARQSAGVTWETKMVQKTFDLVITSEDITNGRPTNPLYCAAALAFRRTTEGLNRRIPSAQLSREDGARMWCEGNSYRSVVPGLLAAFIQAFDRGKAQPCTIKLEADYQRPQRQLTPYSAAG